MSENKQSGTHGFTRRKFLQACAAGGAAFLHGTGSAMGSHFAFAGDIDYSRAIDTIRQNLPTAMTANHVRSVAVALVDGQRLIWADGFGYTDISNTKPVTADTRFSLQSISKTYTATAFMIAISNGWFQLDDPLKKYLPGFRINSRYGRGEADKITFRHLLSHWAGLPHEAPLGNNFDERPCTLGQHIESISDAWLRFPVGKTYCYSNLGIDLAGYALQQRSQKPFDRFLRDTLFTPLGMTSSTFSFDEAKGSGLLVGGDNGTSELLTVPVPMIPSGGMYSSVKDMARFISFHLAGGRLNGKRLISEHHLAEMYTPQFPVLWQRSGYGLGIFKKRFHGSDLLWHSGGGYGYTTVQQWVPEHQIGVAVLSNDGDGSSLTGDLADRALEQMIEAKFGKLPATETAILTDRPIVQPDEKRLRRLEGTYKSYSGLLSIVFDNGHLQMVRGGGARQLDAHSDVEFTANTGTPNTERLVFNLDAEGKPDFVHNLGDNGTDFFIPNDRPDDPPGPDRPEWSRYTGDYKGKIYRTDATAKILIKNGYLYTGRGLKLREGTGGMFFTPDGEAVIFRDGQMVYGNRPYVKVVK